MKTLIKIMSILIFLSACGSNPTKTYQYTTSKTVVECMGKMSPILIGKELLCTSKIALQNSGTTNKLELDQLKKLQTIESDYQLKKSIKKPQKTSISIVKKESISFSSSIKSIKKTKLLKENVLYNIYMIKVDLGNGSTALLPIKSSDYFNDLKPNKIIKLHIKNKKISRIEKNGKSAYVIY